MRRGLAFDFPGDAVARGVAGAFMWGPAFLVAPLTTPGPTRGVYLPAVAGGWTDFFTGGAAAAGAAGGGRGLGGDGRRGKGGGGGGVSHSDVVRAAKLANCHDFISKGRGGYEVLAGSNGAQLSGGLGGQKHARALQKKTFFVCFIVKRFGPQIGRAPV